MVAMMLHLITYKLGTPNKKHI